MMNFQRKGAKSNTRVGKDFEEKIQAYFQNQGVELAPNTPVSDSIRQYLSDSRFKEIL